jgi:hypothetical protein
VAVHLRTSVITVTWFDTTEVPITRVLEARTTWGLDIAIAEASFVVPTISDLAGATYFSFVTITLDGGGGGPPNWKGFITSFDFSYYPQGITVHCRGPLILAQLQEGPPYAAGAGTASTSGTGFDAQGGYLLVPADLSGITDEAMVLDVLSKCSADTFATVSGTSRLFGTIATTPFRWAPQESALSVIQRIDEVSADVPYQYRTYDAANGSIRRAPLDLNPATPTPDWTFTEGVDIFSGQGQKDILASKNRVSVMGYDPGAGTGPANYTVQVSNAFLTAATYITLQLDNPMIEVQTEADVVGGNQGMSCEAVANALLHIWSVTQERATFTTPLDVDLGLGDIIAITTPSTTPERLGTVGDYVVQGVARSIGQDGTFSVDLTIVRGAS